MATRASNDPQTVPEFLKRFLQIEELHKKAPRLAWFLAICIPWTIPVTIIPLLQVFALSKTDSLIIVIIIMAVGSLASSLYFKGRFRILPLPQGGEYFAPVGKPTDNPAFGRKSELDELTALLKQTNTPRLVIVSGESGCGKSTLVRDILPPVLRALNWNTPKPIQGFSGDNTFRVQIRATVTTAGLELTDEESFTRHPNLNTQQNSRSNILFVFDQFEQFLKSVAIQPELESLQKWFCTLIGQLLQLEGVYCLVVVRMEYYYYLRILREYFRNTFRNTMHIPGIKFQDSNNIDDITKLGSILETLLGETLCREVFHDMTSGRDEISPIEIQMAGFVIADIYARSGKDSSLAAREYLKLGGYDELIPRYFTRHMQSSSDPELAAAVLYALSHGASMRQKFNDYDLAKILHRPIEEIRRVMSILELNEEKSSGLVSREGGYYFVHHDYLAERYLELSGLLMDPIERDNISFFCDYYRRRDRELAQSREDHVMVPSGPQVYPLWPNVCFALLIAVLGVRLVTPGLEFWHLLAGYLPSSTASLFDGWRLPIDLHYLPSFMASFVSGIYVWGVNRHLFLLMLEKRFVTITIIAISIIMILSGTLLAHAWLVYASMAGFLIAIRFQISYSGLVKGTANKQMNLLGKLTRDFYTSMAVTMCFGLLLSYLFYFLEDRSKITMGLAWFMAGFEGFIAVIYTIFMIVCIGKHARRQSAAIYLSIWDRLRVSRGKSFGSVTR